MITHFKTENLLREVLKIGYQKVTQETNKKFISSRVLGTRRIIEIEEGLYMHGVEIRIFSSSTDVKLRKRSRLTDIIICGGL